MGNSATNCLHATSRSAAIRSKMAKRWGSDRARVIRCMWTSVSKFSFTLMPTNLFVLGILLNRLHRDPKRFLTMATDSSEEEPDSVFMTAIAVEMGLGAVALILGWLTNVDVRQWIPRFEPDNVRVILAGLGLGVVAALPMLAAISLIERIDWAPIRRLKELEDMPMVSTLLGLSKWELIAISISAGVGEELLVRGWLMGWITGPLPGATTTMLVSGLLVSSIAFGLMHPITPAYAVIACFIGLYLGGLVLWTENLIVPIVAHAVYDAVHLLMAKREQSSIPAS
jgi:uncharacterized protein